MTLRVPWRDGTRALLFEPLEFLARLAALTPRPAINLLLYHGVRPAAPLRRRPGALPPRGHPPRDRHPGTVTLPRDLVAG